MSKLRLGFYIWALLMIGGIGAWYLQQEPAPKKVEAKAKPIKLNGHLPELAIHSQLRVFANIDFNDASTVDSWLAADSLAASTCKTWPLVSAVDGRFIPGCIPDPYEFPRTWMIADSKPHRNPWQGVKRESCGQMYNKALKGFEQRCIQY